MGSGSSRLCGPDEKGIAALGINPERLKIIIMQLVRLMQGGTEVRMSKRAGEFVTMDELLEEVGVDAARWFFERGANTHMDFDLDLAKEKSEKIRFTMFNMPIHGWRAF